MPEDGGLIVTRNEQILHLRSSGFGPTAIAKELGVTKNTVVGVCYRQTVKSAFGQRPQYDYEFRRGALGVARRLGLTAAARQLGCTPQTLRNWGAE